MHIIHTTVALLVLLECLSFLEAKPADEVGAALAGVPPEDLTTTITVPTTTTITQTEPEEDLPTIKKIDPEEDQPRMKSKARTSVLSLVGETLKEAFLKGDKDTLDDIRKQTLTKQFDAQKAFEELQKISPKILKGMPCITDEDCKNVPGTSCQQYFCACKWSHPFSSNGTCLPDIGQPCEDEVQCTTRNPNSKCMNGECDCPSPTYIRNNGNTTCLRVASKLGDSCVENEQCQEGLAEKVGRTMCLHRRCTCFIEHMIQNDKCVEAKSIGVVCIKDEDCKNVAKTTCQQNVCACERGFVPSSEGKCIPVIEKMSGKCEDDIQCMAIEGAICYNSSCVCKERHVPVGRKCAKEKELGEECEFNDECVHPDEEAAFPEGKVKRGCVDNKCACVAGNQQTDLCTWKSGAGLSFNSWSSMFGLIIALVVSKTIA